ncbi:WD repeat-containing protein 3 [Portunus trituberculatus]|uniref:WD repeat-containing protein 3 n=1 Tax=Portunus trituberculatus TaxID=210409 RepID=A0A5B7ELD4_PORTR|nr:WD repeat-containing protein 3 [Portunus trituberculatus]
MAMSEAAGKMSTSFIWAENVNKSNTWAASLLYQLIFCAVLTPLLQGLRELLAGGKEVLTLDGEVRGTVTMVEPRPAAPGSLDNTHLAVGYSEGTVVVFDLMSGEPLKFTGHKGGVSSLCWDPQGMRVASGSEDGELVVWDVSIVEVVQMGSVLRSRGDRVCGLQSDGRVVACHGKGPVIDLFAVLTDEEVATKAAKRGRKERKRAREAGDTTTTTTSNTPLLADEIQKLPTLRAANKLLGVDVLTERSGMVRLAALHNDNSVALLSSDLNAKEVKKEKKKKKEEEETEVGQVSVLGRPGHRTEIRAVAFTSLSDQVVTGSAEALKVWNRGDTQATLTVPCGPVTTLVVVPGDRHALVGTRSGHLQLIDFASATLLEDILAHEPDETAMDTGVWSVALTHDGRGFVSGGSDKMVKFWKCLSVCPRGAWVLSGGQDRSLRLWERTQEPLVLEEEREEELKRKEEEEGTTATQRRVLPGEEGAQAVRPTVTTHHTEKAADMILEALGVYREQVESGGKAEPHYLMTYVYKTSDPLRLVLEVLRRVKSSVSSCQVFLNTACLAELPSCLTHTSARQSQWVTTTNTETDTQHQQYSASVGH